MSYFDGDRFNKDKYYTLLDKIPQDHHFNDNNNNGSPAPAPAHVPDNCYKCSVVKFASERIHTIIAEENSLRHNRITWFANIEGFLWLSFAAVVSEPDYWERRFWLMTIIPVIGILICLSAISAIWDADKAITLLFEKWRVIQTHEEDNPFTCIPVLGLTPEESKPERASSIPRWHFALFVLIAWIMGFVGTLIINGIVRKRPWWYYLIISITCFTATMALLALIISESDMPKLIVELGRLTRPIDVWYQEHFPSIRSNGESNDNDRDEARDGGGDGVALEDNLSRA